MIFLNNTIFMHSVLLPRVKDKSLVENLDSALETSLPGPPDVHKNEQQVECGICYAQFLPIGNVVCTCLEVLKLTYCQSNYLLCGANIDEELGAKSGSGTDYTCENTSCSRAFHSVCLRDWLRSITTTRQYVEFLVALWFFQWCFLHWNAM